MAANQRSAKERFWQRINAIRLEAKDRQQWPQSGVGIKWAIRLPGRGGG